MTVAKSDTVVVSDSWGAIFKELASVDPHAAKAHAEALNCFAKGDFAQFREWVVFKFPSWTKSPSLMFLMGVAIALEGDILRGAMHVKKAEGMWRQIQKDRDIKSALLKRIEVQLKRIKNPLSLALRRQQRPHAVIMEALK